jgi:hypothetical protein
MDDLLFSRPQYNAIISRLEGLKLDIELLYRQRVTIPPHKLDRIDSLEVQRIFQISPRTILRWRKLGEIPYERVGRRIYYDPKLLFEYAQKLKDSAASVKTKTKLKTI